MNYSAKLCTPGGAGRGGGGGEYERIAQNVIEFADLNYIYDVKKNRIYF